MLRTRYTVAAVALPLRSKADPGFSHARVRFPRGRSPDAIRLLIGDAFGWRSPVATAATLYLDVAADPTPH
jgi:hypothetical protein